MSKSRLGKLTPERWQRIQEVLDAFDDLPVAERAGLLDATGREDSRLRRQVEALLRNEDRLDTVLERPVFPICSENLDAGLLVPRIGPYKLVRELGEGGMGTVYLAIQEEPFQRRVALKLIRPRINHRDSIRRFQEERQILARVRHPNVAQLYDGGTTSDGRPYFAMEYVEGLPIHEYCDDRRLTTRQRLELMLQVCSAVHLAHQKLRVVHRDLKPGNILVTADGIPKLLDFGIAKVLDADPRPPDSEAHPTSVWVPHYSSPEQLAGLPLTTASDIYSLGVLLYRLLTGRLPYRSKDAEPESARRAIREDHLEKPSTAVLSTDSRVEGGKSLNLTSAEIGQARSTRPGKLSRHLAGDVDAIVLKALATDPEDRYTSVDRLAEDVRRHLKNLPVKARAGSFRYVAGKFFRRHRFGLAAAALILLTLTASAWTVTALQRREVAAKARAERTVELLDGLIAVFNPDANEDRVTSYEFLEQAQQLISKDLQSDPELLAKLLSGSLTTVYRQLGYVDEAESVLNRALEIFRELHTENHAKTAEMLNNLGAALYRKGDYAGAERLYFESLKMRQELEVAETELVGPLSNLAAILTYQRKFAEAEQRYRQVLETQEKHFGEGDSRLAINYRNLGMAHFFQSELDQAELLLRQALELELAAPEPKITKAAEYRSTLARVLHAKENLDDAEHQLTDALDVQRRLLPPGHEDLGRSERNLAAVMLARGESDTAGILLTNAQLSLREAKPPGDWEVAELESLLGLYLAELGDYKLAETCLIESHETLEKARGANVIYTKQAAERSVRFHEMWDKSEPTQEYPAVEGGLRNENEKGNR